MSGPLKESDISPTYTAVLMVVVTVIVGSTVAVLALDYTDALREPAPLVAETEGTLTVAPDGTQTVVLRHRGGDAVPVETIAVTATFPARGASGRLVNLPVRGPGARLSARHVRGDAVFATENGSVGGVLHSPDGTDRTWTGGDDIRFEVAASIDVRPDERVVVRVVHEPTNATVAEETLTPHAGTGADSAPASAGHPPR